MSFGEHKYVQTVLLELHVTNDYQDRGSERYGVLRNLVYRIDFEVHQ